MKLSPLKPLSRFAGMALAVLLAVGAAGCKPSDTPIPTPTAPSPDGHNSRISLDWPGAYKGVLPCADCAGIETVVTLRADGRYSRHTRYLGKSPDVFSDSGEFEWDGGGVVTLLHPRQTTRFQVAEGRLIMLDQAGRRITGALADHYVLTQLPAPGLADTHWRLMVVEGVAVTDTPSQPYLVFTAADKRVHGSGGCNRLTGGYEARPPQGLRFTPLAVTKMACLTGVAAEQAFLAALARVTGYAIAGNTLTLYHDDAVTATFEALHLPPE